MFKFFSLFFNVKASKSLINFCDYKKKAKAIDVHYPDQLGAKGFTSDRLSICKW